MDLQLQGGVAIVAVKLLIGNSGSEAARKSSPPNSQLRDGNLPSLYSWIL